MIDYVKLLLAKKLIKELSKDDWYFMQYIQTCFDDIETVEEISYTLCNPHEYDQEFKNIDDLISKLEELTHTLPKYEIGQKVWFHFNNMLKHYHVDAVDKDEYGIWGYHLGDFYIKEYDLYTSRKDLINSRIDYWKTLLSEELEQHISSNCYPSFIKEVKGFNVEVPHQEPLCVRNDLETINEIV